MIPQRDNRLICCKSDFGPIFSWNDFAISDQCDKKRTSLADFPGTFNKAYNPYPQDEQESRRALCGVSEGINFKVVEYEVFKVEFDWSMIQ